MTAKGESQSSFALFTSAVFRAIGRHGQTAYGALSLARGTHAGGSDAIKIGLIGCGGQRERGRHQRHEH